MCVNKCKNCNEEIKGEGKNFCGHQCYYKWNHNQKIIRDFRKKKGLLKPVLNENCKWCDKELKDKRKQFCNSECYFSHRSGGYRDCKECGKSFRGKDRIFCGQKCMSSFKAKDPKLHYGFKRTEEWKKEHSLRMTGVPRPKPPGYVSPLKGTTRTPSDSWRENNLKHLKALNERGFENKGGRCPWYNYKGFRVQGRYELYFLIKNFDEIDSKGKPFKTPIGPYTPDFKMKDGTFREIKSTYTIKTCLKSKQIQKIKWFRENVAELKFEVLKEKTVYDFMRDVVSKLQL